MPFFGPKRYNDRTTTTTTPHRRHRFGFKSSNRDRVAGGYKSALANPNTTHDGRKRAKWELHRMGRGNEAHVSLMTKIKRTLGIRSTPRVQRTSVGESRRHGTTTGRTSGRSRFF